MTSSRRVFASFFALGTLTAAAACGSTLTDVAGSGDAGSPATDAGASPGSDSGTPQNPADSGPPDGGPQLGGWTAEMPSTLETFGTGVSTLVSDPSMPRHLLIGMESQTSPIFEWKNGIPAMPLVAAFGDPTAEYAIAGSGFDPAGGLYAYISGFPGSQTATPFKLAVGGHAWGWTDLPPPFVYPSWPPRSFAAGEGTSPHQILYSEVAVWNITGATSEGQDTMTWPNWQSSALTPADEGGFGSVTFVPGDGSTFLATMRAAPIVHRCTFAAQLTCDTSQSTGFPAGSSLGAIAIASSDPKRVYVFGSASNASHLFSSSDGGVTFTDVPLPTWPVGIQGWSVSPTAPDTIALHLPAYEDENNKSFADQLVFTKDAGATWTSLALPDTPTTDVDAFVFDAAGTLFLSRSSALFSRAL